MTEHMPATLAGVYESISDQLSLVFAMWNTYTLLFAKDVQRIQLMNDTVPGFFTIVQRALVDDVLLSISRLTDPANTGRLENASLVRLASILKPIEGFQEYDAISQSIGEIVADCEPFRVQRNKRIAHLDLLTTLDPSKFPLPMINRQMVNNVLERMATFLNQIQLHYEKSTTAYASVYIRGNGDDLMFLLEQAVKYNRLRLDNPRLLQD